MVRGASGDLVSASSPCRLVHLRQLGANLRKPNCSETGVVDFISGGIQAEVLTWRTYPIRASGTQMGSRNETFYAALSIHNCGSCRRYSSKPGAFLPTDHHSGSQQHPQASARSPMPLKSVPALEDNQAVPGAGSRRFAGGDTNQDRFPQESQGTSWD